MDRETRETLNYFGYGLLIGVAMLLVVGVFLFGCGDNEHGTPEWICGDCPDLPPKPWGTSSAPDAAPSAPDARTLEADASSPDASSPDASSPDASSPDASSPDAAPAPSCDETTCDPIYGYCANGSCEPWPPIPPPSTWDCGGNSDGIGCCVSVCQHECDLNLPNSLWSACSNSCELRCKDLLR